MHILTSSINLRFGMIIRQRMTLNRSLTIGKNLQNHQVLPVRRKINISSFDETGNLLFKNNRQLRTSSFASIRKYSTKKPPSDDRP